MTNVNETLFAIPIKEIVKFSKQKKTLCNQSVFYLVYLHGMTKKSGGFSKMPKSLPHLRHSFRQIRHLHHRQMSRHRQRNAPILRCP